MRVLRMHLGVVLVVLVAALTARAQEEPKFEPIFCCRQGRDGRTPHHGDAICVAFDDGSARLLTRAELGLQPGDPIVVGPESKSPLLRKLIFARKKKE